MDSRFSKAAQAFQTVCETMATLRGPGGCLWDAKQTLKSVQPYLIEEAFEAVDAAEQNDPAAHCEELGDVLLQIVFQSEIAQETKLFDIAQVALALDAKLKRRHPDVFVPASQSGPNLPAAAFPTSAEAALVRWEAIKATERSGHKGRLSGIPRSMPSLLRAWRTADKAAAAGFDWPAPADKFKQVTQALGALGHAIEAAKQQGPEHTDGLEAGMGDIFLALAQVCRDLKLDPEAALRGSVERFHRRFEHMEHQLAVQGRALEHTSLDAMLELWEEAQADWAK